MTYMPPGHDMPASWQWVPDARCYLHDSGNYVVWEAAGTWRPGGWYGYARIKDDGYLDRHRVGPHFTPNAAALQVVARHGHLSGRPERRYAEAK